MKEHPLAIITASTIAVIDNKTAENLFFMTFAPKIYFTLIVYTLNLKKNLKFSKK